MKNKRRSNHAVSEVLATVLLLGITIALFGFLNFIVFSFSFESPAPSVSLIGSFSADGTYNNITIEHNGGESLDGTTEIIITVGSTTNKSTVRDIIDGTTDWKLLPLKDDKNPDKWDFGETIQFNSGYDFTDTIIQASVMDPSTNTLILSVVLQHGPATSVVTNKPPTITNPVPSNGSTGNLLSLTWKIQIDDPESDPFTWTIQCSNGQTNSGAGPNGQKTLVLTGLSYSTTYKIWVNATDPIGSNLFTRKWYTFTTTGNLPPAFGTPTPANGSIDQSLSLPWNIPINDLEGDIFTWTIQCSNGQTNSAAGATNGTKTLSISGLSYSTMYRIWVNATDPTGSGLWTRRWYTFTTKTTTVINLKPNLAYDNTSGSDHKLTAVELASLNFSDITSYSSFGAWGSTFAKRIEFNFPNISSSAIVLNVTLHFEWARLHNNVNGARLGIWDGSTWIYYTLTLGTPGTDVVVTKYLSGIINTAAKVNSLKLVFQATSSNNKTTSHDWVQVDVTYT